MRHNSHIAEAINFHQIGLLEKAEEIYLKVLKVEPQNSDLFNLMGVIAYQRNQLETAFDFFNQAIAINPNVSSYHSNRGAVYKQRGQFLEAMENYKTAIFLDPKSAEIYTNLSAIQIELGQLEEAISNCETAIFHKPEFAEAYYNRANAYKKMHKYELALDSYEKSIALKPTYVQAYYNMGNLFQEFLQLPSAIKSFNEAIRLSPEYPEPHLNSSICKLLCGSLIEGWELYEWRWKTKELIGASRNFIQPFWLDGECLKGKTILLHAEQGLGDTIQFCRYVKLIVDLGAKVIIEVQRPLVKILTNFAGVTTLIAQGDPVPDFDYHCPLLSLPLAFKTDINSIPNPHQYLIAEPSRVALWKDRLGSDSFKIGISWQGSTGPGAKGRSFNLAQLVKIAHLPNVQLISLQKGYGSEQMQNLPFGMKVLDLGDALDADGAFLDTAAVMKNLDLVISCDTAVVHLAGALGVKTWVALKFVPDWRWMLDRTDSPWYPSLTLYRQEVAGEWGPVFDKMRQDLIAEFQNK
jgi:hypothetical protein